MDYQEAREVISRCHSAIVAGGERDSLIKGLSPTVVSPLLVSRVIGGQPDLRMRGIYPGAAVGKLALSLAQAQKFIESGEPTIVGNVRDLRGLVESPLFVGYISPAGARDDLSHSTGLIAQFQIPSIHGGEELKFDEKDQTFYIGELPIREGQIVTIDGGSGALFLQEEKIFKPSILEEFSGKSELSMEGEVLGWIRDWSVDNRRRHGVGLYVNTEQVSGWDLGEQFGADGIGLFRTENLFLDSCDRQALRAMLLRNPLEDPALTDVLYDDHFVEAHVSALVPLLRRLSGRVIRIRLLDAPFHEFIPREFSPEESAALIELLSIPAPNLMERVDELREINPALGFRGSRLLIEHPELLDLQLSGIRQAITQVEGEGIPCKVQILLPFLSGFRAEANLLKQLVVERLEQQDIPVLAMLETPGALAMVKEFAEIFPAGCVIGSNDLTQLTLGVSRSDLRSHLQIWERGYADLDPFVGFSIPLFELIRDAMRKLFLAGMKEYPLSICGLHASEPESQFVALFEGIQGFSVAPGFALESGFNLAKNATVREMGLQVKARKLGGA